ncbi:hypothetical protein [Aquimarina algiphila]|uniref:Uncharacterized protein n=1 Tax=Aquimarina algiphila TaxID=2047982 RepID=A0A554VA21_9FLAO|nr:hypothetical protein [Aquimarina algiphila]TSE02328.1 hypothetical protein FOF46_30990 [Aquimarina algiphila]
MDIKKFADWVNSEFDFDCFENDFFEKTLFSTQKEFESSTYNNVPFEIYYAEILNTKFLETYLSRLKLLLQAIPKPGSSVSLSVAQIDLNSYNNRTHELRSSIQKLES